MATTTPNFGWAVPTSTDLVKDGAVAIETLGDSIDASLVDLKGGTTGQVLSKASNTDMDFTWVTDAAGDITGVTAGTGISGGGTSGTVTVTNSMATAIDAKGDLIGGTGADAFARLAVGANGTVLTADSAEATGLKWATSASGSSGLTLIRRSTFSNVANTGTTFDGVFTSTYKAYKVIFETITNGTASGILQLNYRVSGSTQTGSFFRGGYSGFNESGNVGPTFGTDTNTASLVPNTGNVGSPVSGEMLFNYVGNSSQEPQFVGSFYSRSQFTTLFVGNVYYGSINADGFVLKESTGNISGTVAVYGLAIA